MTALRLRTTVVSTGPLVPELLEGGRLILFGEQAPDELHEICALHRPDGATGSVEPGDGVQIGGHELTVTAVGAVANENLQALGHVTLRLDDRTQAPLPGEIVVSGALPPAVQAGMSIEIQGPS